MNLRLYKGKALILQRISVFIKIQRTCRWFMVLAGLLTVFTVSSTLEISDETLAKISNKYGEQAVTRIEQWQKLMKTAKNLPEQEKLRQVNDFFNQRIDFVDDVY